MCYISYGPVGQPSVVECVAGRGDCGGAWSVWRGQRGMEGHGGAWRGMEGHGGAWSKWSGAARRDRL